MKRTFAYPAFVVFLAALALMWITQGSGVNPERFADGMPRGTSETSEAGPPGQWADLLNQTFKPKEDAR